MLEFGAGAVTVVAISYFFPNIYQKVLKFFGASIQAIKDED